MREARVSASLVASDSVADDKLEGNRKFFHADRRWRKLLWIALAAAAVVQVYYVRELLAALVIFTVLFVIGSVIAGVIYLAGRAGETTIALAEPVARRGISYVEEVGKKAFRRPHSAPAP